MGDTPLIAPLAASPQEEVRALQAAVREHIRSTRDMTRGLESSRHPAVRAAAATLAREFRTLARRLERHAAASDGEVFAEYGIER
jgi:hypothetical protein